MRVLFVMRHAGYVRNFESTLRMLCERGHRVHLALQGTPRIAQLDPHDIARQLAEQYRSFSNGVAPPRTDEWSLVGRELRVGLDYLRYYGPEYRNAPKLRERARRDVPPSVLARSEHGWTGTAPGRWLLAAWLRATDRAIPTAPEIDAFIRRIRPDVLAVTPLIEAGAPQVDYVRSAHAQGVRTVLCVASWDNLTNKGLIHGPLDLVAVWNDAMRREAVELHGVPAARVVVTGAAAFDHWFDWRPSVTREAFCARVGLPADRPYLLYLCSSAFIAPREAAFVRSWIGRIRQSMQPALRDVGILVRPHPQCADQWQGIDLTSFGATALWPPNGAAPVDVDSRSDYFNSMFHSTGVVGINTTAQIESAILGRPVHTLLAPEFCETQEGTLHFHHLRHVNGGFLRIARDFEEHEAQLAATIGAAETNDAHCRRFVEAFVRPYGLDTPATPRLVEALERLARQPASVPKRPPRWAPLVRPRLARRNARLEREAKVVADARATRQAAQQAREAKRLAGEAERRAVRAEKLRLEAEDRAERAEAGRAQRVRRLEALVADFSSLSEHDRRNFLRASFGAIPPRAFIDLYAATKPQKLDYPHADILMRVTTDAEEYRLRACAKEPFTIDWIHSHIAAGDVLYDIGANVGAYSLVAARKPGGGARVFAFEPSYPTVATLCANVILNDVANLVTPMPIALSDATKMTVFSLGSLQPGAARHALGESDPEDGLAYPQPIMVYRLDDLIAAFRLPPPNHIKLDVDGGELEVLAGASQTLGSPSLRTLLIEVSTSLSAAITEALERHGLRLDSKISVRNKAGEYAVWYGLFVRGAGAGPREHAGQIATVTR
jgi:FkbM family methyltransferase